MTNLIITHGIGVLVGLLGGWFGHKKLGAKAGAVELAVKSGVSSVEQAAKK